MLSSVIDNILPYVGLLGLNLTALLGPGPEASASAICCSELRLSLSDVVFLSDHGSYSSAIGSMWSLQSQSLQPACVVKPKDAKQVSKAISILSSRARDKGGCKFTVRSGGHSPWGSSNIDGGITVDLGELKEVTLNADKTVTRIGTGNRWFDVYSKLDAAGVTVVGGRVSTVGVGGLLTGGGISFFSPKYGWAADNIVKYEVVLASGEIVEASEDSHPELFWGLKGGSNNFGVVTHFHLRTFPLPPNSNIWGGMSVYAYDHADTLLSHFVDFTKKAEDPSAALISTYGYQSSLNAELTVNSYVYTDTVDGTDFPGSFKRFQGIEPLFSTVRPTNHSDLTVELGSAGPKNFHQVFHTATYANDKALLAKVLEMSREAYQPLSDTRNLSWAFVMQPLTTMFTQSANERTGNTLGIKPSDGNQVLTSISVSWELASESDRINEAIHTFYDKADAYAESLGLKRDFLYLNYCSERQKPIKSYGNENIARMREVSRKYDPEGVFQRFVPRGYKLYTEEEMESIYRVGDKAEETHAEL